MSNNFRRMAVLKKKKGIVNYSFTPKENKLRALDALEDLEPLFKIFRIHLIAIRLS